MQQSHLTRWQAHAPWPKRSQLEQDLRITRAVASMSSEEAEFARRERLHHEGFRRDMDTLLRPGLPNFDVDKAADIVRSEFLRKLPAASGG